MLDRLHTIWVKRGYGFRVSHFVLTNACFADEFVLLARNVDQTRDMVQGLDWIKACAGLGANTLQSALIADRKIGENTLPGKQLEAIETLGRWIGTHDMTLKNVQSRVKRTWSRFHAFTQGSSESRGTSWRQTPPPYQTGKSSCGKPQPQIDWWRCLQLHWWWVGHIARQGPKEAPLKRSPVSRTKTWAGGNCSSRVRPDLNMSENEETWVDGRELLLDTLKKTVGRYLRSIVLIGSEPGLPGLLSEDLVRLFAPMPTRE